MSDTDVENTPPDQTAPESNQDAATRPTGRVRSGLALILSLVAIIGTGYLWYTTLYQNANLFSMDIVGSIDRIKSDSNQIQETLGGTATEIKTLKETQDTIRVALEKINTDLARNRLEWALTETEQLLVIANNRLQLARDLHSSLAALRAADMQLQQLASPKLLPVRKELAREMALLESLDKTDFSGIALRLANMADNVDRLPLRQDFRLHADAELKQLALENSASEQTVVDGGWRKTARSLWRDILSLVRFRDNLENQRPLLPPEQQYFLRENLRLMLYGAQQALLQGSMPAFIQNLKSAQQLLKEYYDVNSQVILAMQEDLAKLQNTKVITELPDISTSLTTLRRLSGRKVEP
jgi:uncharacterized protein HemX